MQEAESELQTFLSMVTRSLAQYNVKPIQVQAVAALFDKHDHGHRGLTSDELVGVFADISKCYPHLNTFSQYEVVALMREIGHGRCKREGFFGLGWVVWATQKGREGRELTNR